MTRDSVNFLEAEWGGGPHQRNICGDFAFGEKGSLGIWMEMAGQMNLPDNRRKRVC